MPKLIVIDPGHDTNDPGSIQYDGEVEATYTLARLHPGHVRRHRQVVLPIRPGEASPRTVPGEIRAGVTYATLPGTEHE